MSVRGGEARASRLEDRKAEDAAIAALFGPWVPGSDTGLVVTSTADAGDGTIGITGDTVNTAARLKPSAEGALSLRKSLSGSLQGDDVVGLITATA